MTYEEIEVDDPYSPGAALEQQAELEERYAPYVEEALAAFLALALLRARRRGRYLTAVDLEEAWQYAVREHIGAAPDGSTVVLESFLADDTLVTSAYEVITYYFATADQLGWSEDELFDALTEALDPNAQSVPEIDQDSEGDGVGAGAAATAVAIGIGGDKAITSKRPASRAATVKVTVSAIKTRGTRWISKVKRMTRTATTRASNRRTQRTLERRGAFEKMWVSLRDSRVREEHRHADGQVVPLSQSFIVGGFPMRYPGDPEAPASLVVNCFPGDTRVAAGSVRAVMRRWYEGDLVEVTTQSGRVLSGTVNHPILTARGWLPLGEIVQGDYAVRARRDVEGASSLNEHDEPTEIAEVFDALDQLSTASRITPRVVDFHGERPNSEVEVVWADGLLTAHSETASSQLLDEFALTGSNEALIPLTRNCALAPRLDGIALSTPSGVRGLNVGETLFIRSGGGEDSVSLDLAAHGDTVTTQELIEGHARHTLLAREDVGRFEIEVTLDEIVRVNRIPHIGHVYNLFTGVGAYTANDLTVHNCRCYMIGVKIDDQG